MNRAFSAYLDLVRFIAAMLVVLDHLVAFRIVTPAQAAFFPEWGREAVVMFFVLSGFVIAYATESRQQSFGQYAVSRAARIYSVALPLLLLAFLGAYALQGVLAEPLKEGYQLQKFYLYIPYHSLFLGELWTHSETPLWLIPYWSLGYEVWYYLLFGVLFFMRGRRRMLCAAAVLLVMGYKLWLLLPVWYAGVLLWRGRERLRLAPAAARAGMLLSVVLLCAYKFWHGDVWLRTLGHAWWPFASLPLGSAERYPGDYLVGLLVLLNFHCALHARMAMPQWASRAARVLAYYTFPLYLVHGLVISCWLALRPAAAGGAEPVSVCLAVLLATWLAGSLADPLRAAMEAGGRRLCAWLAGAGGGLRTLQEK
ncbi:acyltransferase family protein [Herbaspirillum robiniae]|uniref:acyltransferase family protein n=1 Tax=Herbaspirillum robiniae TaxID=2014887 RepID=UPI003D76E69B